MSAAVYEPRRIDDIVMVIRTADVDRATDARRAATHGTTRHGPDAGQAVAVVVAVRVVGREPRRDGGRESA